MSKSWRELKTYWIVPGNPYGPLGFGVTAFSPEDAVRIIRGLGYVLTEDTQSLVVEENVALHTLDIHVQKNMGPIALRGLWYPFWMVGLPRDLDAESGWIESSGDLCNQSF